MLNKAIIGGITLTTIALVAGLLLSPQLPQQLVGHWNLGGQADGTFDKNVGLLLIPIITYVLLLLFWALPKLDPKHANIAEFEATFSRFILVFVLFLLYIHALVLLWNLGWQFDMGQLLSPALGILFYYLGVLLSTAKQNWFIGIRTPWTLSDERVWDKVHVQGAIVFKVCGIVVGIGGLLYPAATIILLLALLLPSVVYLLILSYVEYHKLHP